MLTWNVNESKERLPRALLLCRADFCPGEFWGAQGDNHLLDPRSPRRKGLRCQAQECSTLHGGKCFTWLQKQLCEKTQSRYDQRTVREGSQRGFCPSPHRVVVLKWFGIYSKGEEEGKKVPYLPNKPDRLQRQEFPALASVHLMPKSKWFPGFCIPTHTPTKKNELKLSYWENTYCIFKWKKEKKKE